jgi:excisionase family DNA binding protein
MTYRRPLLRARCRRRTSEMGRTIKSESPAVISSQGQLFTPADNGGREIVRSAPSRARADESRNATTSARPAYLTVHEAAALARCEHKSVRRAIAAGRLRAFRPINKLLIRDDDARAWIEGRPTTTTAPRPELAPPAPSRRRHGPSQELASVAELREIERRVVSA